MCKSKPNCGCGCSDNRIREDKTKDSKYQAFFKKALKKFKVNDPGDFDNEADKKEFFNWIDDNYKAKNEAYEKAIRNLIRRELSAMNESSIPVAEIRRMVREELMESTGSDVIAMLNKLKKDNVKYVYLNGHIESPKYVLRKAKTNTVTYVGTKLSVGGSTELPSFKMS